MPYTLESVVPLGRSYDEYVRMFSLSASDLSGRILGCADGLASFNAVHTGRGGRVVSIDPLYDFPTADIRDRIEETFKETMRQMKLNTSEFVWDRIGTVDDLAALRKRAMTMFLEDYPDPRRTSPCSAPPLDWTDLRNRCCGVGLFDTVGHSRDYSHHASGQSQISISSASIHEVRVDLALPLTQNRTTPHPNRLRGFFVPESRKSAWKQTTSRNIFVVRCTSTKTS